MDFGDAIRAMRNGDRVQRVGWNGKGMWIQLRDPGNGTTLDGGVERMERPYIEMKDAQDMLVPWLASQTDMLATDWQVVP